MTELTKTTDDLRRAFVRDQVLDVSFSGTAYHAIIAVDAPAGTIEFWSVTP